jgi:hypothetical protein
MWLFQEPHIQAQTTGRYYDTHIKKYKDAYPDGQSGSETVF